ncbi:hypothetical protein ACM9HF_13820 [Colwellia sp. RE-S-Sl-9]
MELYIIVIIQFLILMGIGSLFFFRKFLFSYSSEKGKNLATKEDIESITKKIEDVKLVHAKQLESTRAELSSQINTHGFRYEKEYEVLAELSALLVDVRDASLSLRPALDFVVPNKTDEEVKKERLTRYFDALRALYVIREKKRPFYPSEIYQSIRAIEKESRSESIAYQYDDPNEGNKQIAYWDKAKENQDKITELAEDSMGKIRERVTKWETLTSG